ncbi:hypothetical protein AVEN_65845-1 [Araneus ventricosus]|uniref:DDE-1 domain-containing protein n=1 Tax=Araneus ventricosus TaxID=182803 RepID=A0A4Y2TN77_ARAVE|nr:hypothetical protein AVEN_65845-1 [Araneus ventricosus]
MDSHLFSKWFFDIFVPSVKSWQEKANLNGALLLFDNCPAHPGTDFLKSGNIQCLFLPPNATSLLQPMDRGVLESLKRRHRKKLNRKLLFEGESASTVSILEFWKSVNIKDCIYMMSEAWESIPQLTKLAKTCAEFFNWRR